MTGTFEENFSTSIKLVNKIIIPKLKETFPSYDFYSVENDNSPVSRLLDKYGCIDLLFTNNDTQATFGVACRIQQVKNSFRSFTIRESRESGTKTEYKKICSAIDNNFLYARNILQAYISEDQETLINMAIAKTKDIVSFISQNDCVRKTTGDDQHGKSTFIVVEWDKMIEKGVPIRIIN